jgi:hypothetical protein
MENFMFGFAGGEIRVGGRRQTRVTVVRAKIRQITISTRRLSSIRDLLLPTPQSGCAYNSFKQILARVDE